MKYGPAPTAGVRPASSPFFKPGVGPIPKPGPKPMKSPIEIPGMKQQAPAAPQTVSSSIYQSIREHAVSILAQSGNPLSFDGLYDKMAAAGCPLPAEKPKVIVRKVLCNSPDVFTVTNKGLYTINENYKSGTPSLNTDSVAQSAQPVMPINPPQPQPQAAPVAMPPPAQVQPPAQTIQAVQPPQPIIQYSEATTPPPMPVPLPVETPAPVVAQPAIPQAPTTSITSSHEIPPPMDTTVKRILTSSGQGSIRERATTAILNAGRPLSADEVFDKLKTDGQPLPQHTPREVIKTVLNNKSLFRVVDNGRYQPITEQA